MITSLSKIIICRLSLTQAISKQFRRSPQSLCHQVRAVIVPKFHTFAVVIEEDSSVPEMVTGITTEITTEMATGTATAIIITIIITTTIVEILDKIATTTATTSDNATLSPLRRSRETHRAFRISSLSWGTNGTKHLLL